MQNHLQDARIKDVNNQRLNPTFGVNKSGEMQQNSAGIQVNRMSPTSTSPD